MADLKISQLTGATTPLAGTEVVPLVQSGTTKKVAVSDLTAGRTVAMASLGVGTAATAQRLVNISSGAGVSPLVAVGPAAYLLVDNVGGGINYYQANVSHLFTGGVGGGNIAAFYASGGVSISSSPTDPGAGNLSIKGNLVPSTAAKGVNFTANTPAAGMTSQLLNWYEEGAYTPTVAPSTSGTLTLSGSANTLTYTRVGRSVTVTGYLQFSAVSSPVGYISISLPVAIGASPTKSSSGSLFVNNTVAAAMNSFLAVGLQGESVVRVYLGTGTSASATSAQEMKSTSEIYLSFTYFA